MKNKGKYIVATCIMLSVIFAGTVYASSYYSQANAKLNHLESSFIKNYLGSKNLPAFRQYLADAKNLTNRVTNTSDKRKLNNRIVQCENVIVTTEHVVNMETSMDKNYRGPKNLPAFKSYLDRVNSSLGTVSNKTIHQKLSERSYAGANVIRDITVVDSVEYKRALVELNNAIELINSDRVAEGREKAREGLSLAYKVSTSFAKDALVAEFKDIINL
ncbi:MAG: hypothetical protein RSC49_02005 [Clostridium sp.]